MPYDKSIDTETSKCRYTDIENTWEKDAGKDKPLGPIFLCNVATRKLHDDIAVVETSQGMALHLWTPVKLAILKKTKSHAHILSRLITTNGNLFVVIRPPRRYACHIVSIMKHHVIFNHS